LLKVIAYQLGAWLFFFFIGQKKGKKAKKSERRKIYSLPAQMNRQAEVHSNDLMR